MRLAAYGIFMQLPLLLVSSAVFFRKKSMRLALLFFVSALLIGLTGWYSFFVEPYRLQITEYELRAPGLTAPMKIAILSDLQTDSFGDYEGHVLTEVLQLKPDAVLMTGDYIQPMGRVEGEREALKTNQFLRKIRFQAPLGIYATQGDVDGPG